mmetsp:Transcript_85297/g.241700  ORF Transcript_85297/g.241700 Transcript_85297/m.241700 type:complete len:1647 (-) Transcript_85297:29-4969(-)
MELGNPSSGSNGWSAGGVAQFHGGRRPRRTAWTMQDYVVGFKVFDAKSLLTEDGGPCDPFVVVECADQVYQTDTLENKVTSSLVKWNEGFVWPEIRLHPTEFESATIQFKVYSRYFWWKNYLIGQASLQLAFINNRPRHLYARTWLSLRREDGPGCTGELNVSVYALQGPQQAPSATEQNEFPDDPNAENDEGGDDNMDDLSKHVLRSNPEAPKGTPHYVRINVIRVEDLRDLAMGGGPPCPFVTVEFNGYMVQTVVGDRVNQFTFNEAVSIPVVTPVHQDLILVKLWTRNTFSPDELIAQGKISFRELRNTAMPPRWFNLYGWNEEEISDSSIFQEASAIPKPNYFKGRMLLAGVVEPLRHGEELEKAKAEPEKPGAEPGMVTLVLLADVYMVTGAEGRQCRVEVSFGAVHKSTSLVSYDTETVGAKMAADGGKDASAEQADDTDEVQATVEDVNSFTFSENAGRVDALLVMTPEDPASQPYVMVNVYTEGLTLFTQNRRIGYTMLPLDSFPAYEPGAPSKPRFLALEPMPDKAMSRNPPSVLITIEKHNSEDVVRHTRRTIKPMYYIMRAYCFLARRIEHDGMRVDAEPEQYGLRVGCAGVSRTTELLHGPRPLWMQRLDLRVVLCSDSPKEAPTIGPITVTLVQNTTLLSGDLGQAKCIYTHMRKRDALSKWEPYRLEPQWIKVHGGTTGKACGEVLIAFELLQWKHRDEVQLQPRLMWPQPEEEFDEREHFSCLRKATLHFSLHGLRDLVQLPNMQSLGFVSGWSHVAKPMVTVEVNSFSQLRSSANQKRLTFRYRTVIPGGDEKVHAQRLLKWHSKVGQSGEGSNFEFIQVGKLNVLIPDRMLLQPYITIKVWEEPSEMGIVGKALGYDGATHLGESLQSLAHLLPCCWQEGISLDRPYDEQKSRIAESVERARQEARVRDRFHEMSEVEHKDWIGDIREAAARPVLKVKFIRVSGLPNNSDLNPWCTCEIAGKPLSKLTTGPVSDKTTMTWNHEGEVRSYTEGDSLLFTVTSRRTAVLAHAVLPGDALARGFEGEVPLTCDAESLKKLETAPVLELRATLAAPEGKKAPKALIRLADETPDFVNGQALPEPLRRENRDRRRVAPVPIDRVNIEQEAGFSPRMGETTKPAGVENTRKVVHGKLETSTKRPFMNDFWYKNMPLLRNHDITEIWREENVDWNFHPNQTFGFVRCTYKLVDGWEDLKESSGDDEDFGRDDDALAEADDIEESEDDRVKLMRSFEFDRGLNAFAFDEKRFHEHFKGPGSVPSRIRVRLYLVKAVTIFGKVSGYADPYIEFQLGRNIKVSMKNMIKPHTNTPDFYTVEERDIQLPFDSRLEVRIMDHEEVAMSDALIGATVIDLEDRWHSRLWADANRQQLAPLENRPLFTSDYPGKNRGSLEMWVEMIETTQASDVAPSDIRKPPEVEVEVRFVIWGTKSVINKRDGFSNVKIYSKLDCKEYNGENDKEQCTDIHWDCKDGNATFNWRVVYPRIQTPTVACLVQFSLYHAESLSEELIGTLDLNLQEYVSFVSKDLMQRTVGPGDLRFTSVDASAPDDDVGSVTVSLYVMTQMEGTSRRQGLGQSEPNDDPQLLIPTEGREWGAYFATFQIPWPDFQLWKKMIPLIVAAFGFLVSLIVLKNIGIV